MSAFDDTQETEETGSQDLFPEQGLHSEVPESNAQMLKQILEELRSLKQDMASLKKNSNHTTDAFKGELNEYIKSRFTIHLYIEFDEEMKLKIQECSRSGGKKSVIHYASKRYTELRNQLRRKIKNDIEVIPQVTIGVLCRKLFSTLLPKTEDPCSEQRIHLALVLRSYLHRHQYVVQNWNWDDFKQYLKVVIDDSSDDKWLKLKAKDERRLVRFNRES